MGRHLTETIQNQIDTKVLNVKFRFKINSVDYTSYIRNWNLSFDKQFGSATADFVLVNSDGMFGNSGSAEVFVGDVVELSEYYVGDSTEFKKFYGVVSQRGLNKVSQDRTITLQCLDYISLLNNWNLDLAVEGDKEEVRNEELEPIYLPEPNDSLAQLFNFANNSIADNPMPLIKFQDQNHADFTDDQFDGFEILYSTGQLKLGAPLNVKDNYRVLANYSHYTRGLYIEDVIETIITQPDGFGNYLFNETSAQDVIDNHLTDTFSNVEGSSSETLICNLVDLEVTVEHQLTQDFIPIAQYATTIAQDYKVNELDYDSSIMYLTDNSDFELSSGETGTAIIGAYTISYTGTGSGNTITGVTITPIDRNFNTGVTITRITTTSNTSLYLDNVDGFPEVNSGDSPVEIEINGDITTYSGISTVAGGYTLDGIPTTGSYALKTKAAGSYVKYITDYSAGKVWAFKYDNLVTDLTTSDFTFPSGYSGEVLYVDKRYGRLILSEALTNYLSDSVVCTTDYSFKTLQATGIELNRKLFREREIDNRFEAINFLRKYLAPNYIIRTIGDDKIWASYLTQKVNADYDLSLATSLTYLEDEDLVTRTKIWTKNNNPTNIMFGEDVDYDVDDIEAYTGIASKEELMYVGEEKSGVLSETAQSYLAEIEQFDGTDPTGDVIEYLKNKYIIKEYPSEPTTGYRIYATPISNEYGKIILDEIEPVIWLNGVPIDNKVHRIDSVPVKVTQKVQTISEGGGKSKSTSTYTYYYYTVVFPHTSIEPTKPIELYDVQGVLQHTIEANDPNMDYGGGRWNLPGMEQNALAELLATAGYHVLYDSSKIEIDYEDVVFKIDKSLIPSPEELVVRATFEYWAIAVGIRDIKAVVDGRRDTQLQLQFFGEPITGFHLATIDMGAIYDIQAIDLVGGFYKPDEYRKFDVDFTVSMQSSVNGTDFYPISDKTEQFRISGGASVTFQEEDLGVGLQARYLKFNLYDVARLEYGRGRYVVALTEISVYNNIVLEGETRLIPTVNLTQPFYRLPNEVLANPNVENWTAGVLDNWVSVGDVSEENTEVMTGSSASVNLSNIFGNKDGSEDNIIGSSALSDVYMLSNFTATKTMTVSKMFTNLVFSGSRNIQGQIRAEKTGSTLPALLSSSNTVVYPPTGWVELTFSTPYVIEKGTTYSFCIYSNSGGSGFRGLRASNSTGNNTYLKRGATGFSTYSNTLALIYILSETDSQIYQTLTTADYNNKTLSLSAWVNSNKSNTCRIGIVTNDTSSYSDYHTGSGDWEELTLSFDVPSTTTYIQTTTDIVSGIYGNFYFDTFSLKKPGDTVMYLDSTYGFTTPASGETETGYLNYGTTFTYTGISGNTLTGCAVTAGTIYDTTTVATTSLSDDNSFYDTDKVLYHLGDRLKKHNFISDRNLYDQEETNALSKAYLLEYYKNHSKAKVSVMYSPYLQVGQTVSVTDTFNNINSVNYFIEKISGRGQGNTSLTLARYPST